MLSFEDYRRYDAVGLAELVRSRAVTAGELLETAIARAEAVNPRINAIVLRHSDEAREAVRQGKLKGPFAGVPYLLKDLAIGMKGTVTTGGSKLMRDLRMDFDSTLMERTRAAGLVTFGKTHSPELGLSPSSESELFGATRNPWNLGLSAGGSSGGASAAVAAGIVPMAHASDGGGSIRIPASACGLLGLKPTRGRVPIGPKRGEGWGGMSVVHVVSRSVRDAAVMLDATAAPAPGDPYVAPQSAQSFSESTRHAPQGLRIALAIKPSLPVAVHADCVAAARDAAKLLSELGHHVEEADMSGSGDAGKLVQAQAVVLNGNIAATLDETAAALGVALTPDAVERATWMRYERGKSASAADYAAAMTVLHFAHREVAAFMQQGRFDLILQPTMARPPLEIGVLDMNSTDFGKLFSEMMSLVPYTATYNITGQPSISVPLFWNAANLPIGVMLSARFGEDALLLALAAQLEEARPWAHRFAPL